MIKKNKKILCITSLVILLPILFGLLLWNKLPEQIPTHWGADNQVDGWSSRGYAVFAMPLVFLLGHWLCILCTSLDKKNEEQNNKVFHAILWLCPLISLFLSGIVYAAAFGKAVETNCFLVLFMGLLFVLIGNYLPKCKQNYTIGIKVKWALLDEENWNATHRFAGKVWVIAGILMLGTCFLGENIAFYACIILVFAAAILSAGYSYYYFKKKQGR